MSFEKEANGRWYAVIPSWTGPHASLEMIKGADEFLDLLSHYDKNKKVTLLVSRTPITGDDMVLVREKQDRFGATYGVYNFHFPQKVWLCNVCQWVMGEHPQVIYAKKVEDL